ncbi:cytoplasmic protein [Nitratireductor sp. CH_MIT9313-5]|uniref:cytoplasmic protein n=1 Tax=Nitratireductor sp. CH_MIT9313-5 TaxID=3107764 RepID=UPI003009AD3E
MHRSLLAGTFLLLFTTAASLAAAGSSTGLDDEIEGESRPAPSSQIPLPQEGDKPEAENGEPPEGNVTRPDTREETPIPDVLYDISALPEPVQRMRKLLMDAARSGDIENLRPLIGTGANRTQMALGGLEGDPIEFLREISGDDEGQEILAILLEVLEAGFVHLDEGTERELYVWPYFFSVPLEELTPAQKVELFKLVTAGDYEEMRTFGAYIFYRTAITPDGEWLFFVAGD